MHAHEQLIRDFYDAFAKRDAAAMARCYHPDIVFSDPAFPLLRGAEAGAMWAMLVARGKDLEITLVDAQADDSGGSARWEARYTFSQTGRRVHNKISAMFAFKDGKIVRHIDRFSFWRWSRQALGPLGWVLGWSLLVKALVRRRAKASLAGFMEKEG
ncbi:MAG: nuclear transport factor 2 family protein [Betaproteobacteria bacterium]|nr:nuclear transport factor 2 family protein [Betaproteobacteria bacterium]